MLAFIHRFSYFFKLYFFYVYFLPASFNPKLRVPKSFRVTLMHQSIKTNV
jgi:hypothetical protein